MSQVQLLDVISALNSRYPEVSAADWDSVGLVVGNPEATVSKILFTVDVTAEVIEEAIAHEAQLIVAHHPLLLRGVHSLTEATSKGRLLTLLIRHNIALYTAHTNADGAWPGVSDALAELIGLEVRAGVALEVETGVGRVADVKHPVSAQELAAHISQVLPHSQRPVQVAGDIHKTIQPVALCGGAGDSLLEAVATLNVDAYVTSDLRHHVAGEFTASNDCVLINIAHWAGEWPWLNVAAVALKQDLADKVDVIVSQIPTDPWALTITRG
jgi:dinuclear metal center YbgI/SA1388 family protein